MEETGARMRIRLAGLSCGMEVPFKDVRVKKAEPH
jgi:hypothetical protein